MGVDIILPKKHPITCEHGYPTTTTKESCLFTVSSELEVRGFPVALKGHTTDVLESLRGVRSRCCRVRGFVAGKPLE